MPRLHRQSPFPGNRILARFISLGVIVSSLIHRRRKLVLFLQGFAVAMLALCPGLAARADSPSSQPSHASTASAPDPARASSAPTIVIGFLGGFVRHDDGVHSTVQIARNLQKDYPAIAHIETFENRRLTDAHNLILHLLGPDHHGNPTAEEKHAARIILYGHSWGASAVVALARSLLADGIPVLLTIQVDSIAKSGQNDALIPENVEHAANFYQDKGFLHGQQKIQAANADRTRILGNFRIDYSSKPISCPQYPWYDRVFMRSHIEIECDPAVWQRVEDLIRGQLPSLTASQTSTP